MRKAFDDNIPKLKPRLRTAVVVVSENTPETDEKHEPLSATASSAEGDDVTRENESVQEHTTPTEHDSRENQSVPAEPAEPSGPGSEAGPQQVPVASIAQPAVSPVEPTGSADLRRERLEKVKRKVIEAVRTGIRIEPVPEDPVQAAESVLGLVGDLETQLARSRELEKALRLDLAEAKTELARTVTEGRVTVDRLAHAEIQVDEKRKIMEEMLVEMAALEEERDQAVRRVQLLTAQDEERQQQFDDLERRSAEMERALFESNAEDERLSDELEECMTENTQLRAVLVEVTQERDKLAQNVEFLIKERDELSAAKKALEKVHQALAQARARLGT